MTIESVVAQFGESAKAKLSNIAASGQPEDQLRTPTEELLLQIAELCGFDRSDVVPIGESSVAELKTRPDYAVTVSNAQVGFIELKAPGKGADPRKFKDAHDKEQWDKLKSLPNLIYSDGNEFSLWQDGALVDKVVRLTGDIETSGNKLKGDHHLLSLFGAFLRWEPIPPRDAKQLAEMTARLCRLLREEVKEQLDVKSQALTTLAEGWRKMLFPEATDAQFADGYAQAVTFGLLVAKAKNISLKQGLDKASKQLGSTNSLIGTALKIVTEEVESETALKTSIATLTRVLDVVDWNAVSKGDPEAWLYFYEEFLAVYDNNLRKMTGSYYTPPEVVASMVRLVDEILRSQKRFNRPRGLAEPTITVADPAVGTGTFMLGVLRRIAQTVAEREGDGAVPAAVDDALKRLIAFEIQLGPFAVAQLRILAEVTELTGAGPKNPLRMFVTNTLGDPYVEETWLPNTYTPIAESRRQANKIKREEPITVVIGNPPYKEKAKGMGSWVESGGEGSSPILNDWMPPSSWGVSTHAKHLRNLYVYFWRWATWKVFDHDPKADTGIVCFITVAGFLNGPGFQKMRDYLRRRANDIWVIDCSTEGHQPEVRTRIFQGVQQPVCIVIASRTKRDDEAPATVRYRCLPEGDREVKFAALDQVGIDDAGWQDCPSDWRAAFLPQSGAEWSSFPALEDFFTYSGAGVMPGRTWIIAPDIESLSQRWDTLINARADEKTALFHPHLRNGAPGDKHVGKVVSQGLSGHAHRKTSVEKDKGECVQPIRYAFRSFDRQWIIPDSRLINQPNPHLWDSYSEQQVFLTAFVQVAPTSGPAVTFAGLMPDLHHYKGSFGGRAYPLWDDKKATKPNLPQTLLEFLTEKFGSPVSGKDLFAYIAAIASHPGYIERFSEDLVQPGLRIPLTANFDLFKEAVELGSRVIWLQTFGERYVDVTNGRPQGAPRLPKDLAPRIPAEGAISNNPAAMPDEMSYDLNLHQLRVGNGFVENVAPEVWKYEVSGKQVLRQWFSYRKKNRERPIIGDRRPPSKLGDIQPDHWLSEYTSDLIDILNVLTMLVQLESTQADLLSRICEGELVTIDELYSANAIAASEEKRAQRKKVNDAQHTLEGI